MIRGAELDALKASRPEMAGSRFALAWTDEQGRSHLAYNYRRTTVDRDGRERVLFHYANPPTFESDYAAWHVGPARIMGPDESVQTGEFYGLYLDLASRQGRQALKRFLRDADEAGYGVTSWFSTPRSGATTREGAPVTSLTFLLQQGSREEDSPQTR